MKKLFTLAVVAASFALVSCGSSETASTAVDSVAVPVADSVAAPVADSSAVVVDSVKVAADSVAKAVK